MNLREDRWFVRFRGHTLGPLTTDQVMTSLRNRELTDADKIASSQNPAWNQIGAHPAFAPFTHTLREPARKLAPIPSPQEIYQRKARHRAAALPTLVQEAPKAAAAPTPVFAFRSEDINPPARAEIIPAAFAAPIPAKKKRVAGPGKKLGRPRKYPRPEEAAALAAFDAEETAPAQVAAEPAPPLTREELPEEPTPNPAALVEEAPTIPAPKVEAAPVTEAPALAPVIAAAPAPSEIPSEKLAVESLALLESLRDWRRKEEELAQELGQARKAKGPVAPERPAIFREEIYEPAPAPAAPVELRAAESERPARAAALGAWIQSRRAEPRFALFAAALAALTAAAVFFAVEKTRGPENRSFPSPSGPTAMPTSKEDPTPSLRAPTRPQRD